MVIINGNHRPAAIDELRKDIAEASNRIRERIPVYYTIHLDVTGLVVL